MREVIIRNRRVVRIAQIGRRGLPGEGVPTGGDSGEVLAKKTGADYDTEWVVPPTAPVTSVNSKTGDVTLTASDVGAATTAQGAKADTAVQPADNTATNTTYDDSVITANGVAASADTQAALDNTVLAFADEVNQIIMQMDGKEDKTNKDTDGTLAANSDTKYPSQKAVKTYTDTKDAQNVKLTGNQTIAGVKTFTSNIKATGGVFDNGYGKIDFIGFFGGLVRAYKDSADAQGAIQLYGGDSSLSFGPGGTTKPDTNIKRTGVNQLDFGSAKLQSVADPVNSQDVATKNYVDANNTAANTSFDDTITAPAGVTGNNVQDIIISTLNAMIAAFSIGAPGTDTSKPAANTVPPGSIRLSTDINGGTLYVSNGSDWLQAAPGINEPAARQLVLNRFGGDATTGSQQTFTGGDTDITDANGSFTLPANGRPVLIKAVLPIVSSNVDLLYRLHIKVSTDTSHWVLISGGATLINTMTTNGIGSGVTTCKDDGRIPMPTFDSSATSPNKINPGDTIYYKCTMEIGQVGKNWRSAWSASKAYAPGDGVSYSSKFYVCNTTRSATATTPDSDTSHWTQASVTAYYGYNGFFGYLDSRVEVMQV